MAPPPKKKQALQKEKDKPNNNHVMTRSTNRKILGAIDCNTSTTAKSKVEVVKNDYQKQKLFTTAPASVSHNVSSQPPPLIISSSTEPASSSLPFIITSVSTLVNNVNSVSTTTTATTNISARPITTIARSPLVWIPIKTSVQTPALYYVPAKRAINAEDNFCDKSMTSSTSFVKPQTLSTFLFTPSVPSTTFIHPHQVASTSAYAPSSINPEAPSISEINTQAPPISEINTKAPSTSSTNILTPQITPIKIEKTDNENCTEDKPRKSLEPTPLSSQITPVIKEEKSVNEYDHPLTPDTATTTVSSAQKSYEPAPNSGNKKLLTSPMTSQASTTLSGPDSLPRSASLPQPKKVSEKKFKVKVEYSFDSIKEANQFITKVEK